MTSDQKRLVQARSHLSVIALHLLIGLSSILSGSSAYAVSAVQLALGAEHSCALLSDGTVKCWGTGALGQNGSGSAESLGDDPGEMGLNLPAVNLGTGVRVAKIYAGENHSCAILESGAVKCWGSNSAGQLGLGDTRDRGSVAGSMGNALPTVNLGSGRRARALALGATHTCVLLDNQTVKCWGANSDGQLGLGDVRSRGISPGDMGDALPAIEFGNGRVPVAISASRNFSCTVFKGGALLCWGQNNAGQLGQENTLSLGGFPSSLSRANSVNLGSGVGVLRISSGRDFNCVETARSQIKCFGLNQDGRLGVGDVLNRGSEVGSMGLTLPAVDLEPGLAAREAQCGDSGCCAIINLSGALKCWGANESGQLGLEDRTSRGGAPSQMSLSLPFVELGKLSRVAHLAVGAAHACVILESGPVKCWGRNNQGQLGIGTRNSVGDLPASMGEVLRETSL